MLLNRCGQPPFGRQLDAWRLLDTRFGTGLDFLTTWQAWRFDAARPKLLHYVALTDSPVSPDELRASAAVNPDLRALAEELAGHWFGLLPGFHRFSLNEGCVLLTLCVGELTPLLRQQQFSADAIELKSAPDGQLWDLFAVKALVRCCRRGTRLTAFALHELLRAHLVQCGFDFEQDKDSHKAHSPADKSDPAPLVLGQFNPRWVLKNSRSDRSTPEQTNGHFQQCGTCVVIGAGVAGASVAAALAQRGWQVQVLDAEAAPAAGASGLPVGLVVPHVSVNDCTLSRLSRSGVRLMLQHAQRLLNQGEDWGATGTLERRFDDAAVFGADWPAANQAWSRLGRHAPCVAEWLRTPSGLDVDVDRSIWHAQAAWLKPAQLVRAWLKQPGISFQGHANVAGLRREGKAWAVLDATDQVLARADRVVIANAMGAIPLMASLAHTRPEAGAMMAPFPVLQGVRGQLSWGLHAGLANDAFPPFPVNGSGSVIPQVPTADGLAWYAGANYQPETQAPSSAAEHHQSNLMRLSHLLPDLGAVLSPRFDAGAVNLWENTRCVTRDRLPLVGPLTAPMADEAQSSVWLCVGMGSRGLTLSALCAELLAAQWSGEPLPIEASLAAALNAQRHASPVHQNNAK